MKKQAKLIVAAFALLFGIQSIALPVRSHALVAGIVTAAGGPAGGAIALAGLMTLATALPGGIIAGAISQSIHGNEGGSTRLANAIVALVTFAGIVLIGLIVLDGEDSAYSPIAFQPLPESALQNIPGMTAPLLNAFNNEMEELTAGMEDNTKTATETLAAGSTREQAIELSQKTWRDSGISPEAIQAAGLVLNHAIQAAN